MAPAMLEMTVMAAEDLKDVATFGKMNVYAVVWVDPFSKHSTRILRKGGKNPVWNEWIAVPLDSVRFYPNAYVTLQIFSEASMGDKVVGTARFPMQEISRISPAEGDEPALVTLQLQRPSGRAQGILSLSLRLTGDPLPWGQERQLSNAMEKSDGQDPVIGIPVPPYPGAPYYANGVGTTSTGYPSLTSIESRDGVSGSEMIPHAYPPPYQSYPGYYAGPVVNYPNQAPYSYVQRPQPTRNNGSLLLSLLWGAIGGLILGDILS